PGESLVETMRRREQRRAGGVGPLFPTRAPSPAPGTGRTREPLEVYEVPGKPFAPPPHRAEAREAPPSVPADHDPTAPVLQVARTYLIREVHDEEGGFEIIDQHALHERINFEALKRDVESGVPEMQRFLVPELVEVSRDEIRRIEPHLDELRAIGIDVAVFGETTLAVHGVPVRLRRPEPEALVREILRS
ncbi:MAG: hypothetical protein KDA32_15775, partial [Phycisphaerales bacterium]|nr:hypothetical protein [Phycisphaerales bacterium]